MAILDIYVTGKKRLWENEETVEAAEDREMGEAGRLELHKDTNVIPSASLG